MSGQHTIKRLILPGSVLGLPSSSAVQPATASSSPTKHSRLIIARRQDRIKLYRPPISRLTLNMRQVVDNLRHDMLLWLQNYPEFPMTPHLCFRPPPPSQQLSNPAGDHVSSGAPRIFSRGGRSEIFHI